MNILTSNIFAPTVGLAAAAATAAGLYAVGAGSPDGVTMADAYSIATVSGLTALSVTPLASVAAWKIKPPSQWADPFKTLKIVDGTFIGIFAALGAASYLMQQDFFTRMANAIAG